MTKWQLWYQKNKKQRAEYMKAYRAANPDKVRAQKRRAYHRNPKKSLARNKRWREKNRERTRWYKKHFANLSRDVRVLAQKKVNYA